MGQQNKSIRILCIGPPLLTTNIGGAEVLFAKTVEELRTRGFDVRVLHPWFWFNADGVGIVWLRWLIKALMLLLLCWRVPRHGWRSRLVFLNTAPYPRVPASVFVVWTICRLMRRPLAVRFFGGSLGRTYPKSLRRLSRWTWLRSERVYVETQQIIGGFPEFADFRWLPNTRDIKPPETGPRDSVRNLVFISRLDSRKGIYELLEACRSLPEQCHLYVYGPPSFGFDMAVFDGHPKATHRSILDPADVPRVLSEHDLLLLPTFYPGEGHPGIIVEAFQCHVPVIATMFSAIPEVVQHEENGLLVEPGSVDSLKAAIDRILNDPELYRRLCVGAKERGEFFRSGPWYDRVARDLRSLVA
ncbi:MAG: glycosyltransferase family 4 protein [Dehalococcoidia bacterium]|nr:glycosyltransferase family 4 protein [Dehalococcoidia bacterium]